MRFNHFEDIYENSSYIRLTEYFEVLRWQIEIELTEQMD
ncbi:MAG: hypothetical protein K0S04_453 [Herbinix sp.]|jgi:hypothetical protein|nr:hypothetical protein [Herbinix sp.]